MRMSAACCQDLSGARPVELHHRAKKFLAERARQARFTIDNKPDQRRLAVISPEGTRIIGSLARLLRTRHRSKVVSKPDSLFDAAPSWREDTASYDADGRDSLTRQPRARKP
jgi:hypothetical protein